MQNISEYALKTIKKKKKNDKKNNVSETKNKSFEKWKILKS